MPFNPLQVNPHSQPQLLNQLHSVQPSIYAGPAVRLLARELGVDLAKVAWLWPHGAVSKKMM